MIENAKISISGTLGIRNDRTEWISEVRILIQVLQRMTECEREDRASENKIDQYEFFRWLMAMKNDDYN